MRIQAKEPMDFSLLKAGGCNQKCNFRFNSCGHSCENLCHTLDKEHENEFKCVKTCLNKLNCGHECPKSCEQIDECGDCKVIVKKHIAQCNHEIFVSCDVTPDGSCVKKSAT